MKSFNKFVVIIPSPNNQFFSVTPFISADFSQKASILISKKYHIAWSHLFLPNLALQGNIFTSIKEYKITPFRPKKTD